MKNILWFSEIRKENITEVGGKGANLGELVSLSVPVPPGFVVTSQVYFDFLKYGSLVSKIRQELRGLTLNDPQKLLNASEKIKTALLSAGIPPRLKKEIEEAYRRLSGVHDRRVAVRSSATAEDLPNASFAGQQETFLNVEGAADLVKKVQACWASLFEPRAIFYRQDKGFDHFKVGLAVVIQEMVESEVSGIMFTVDPLTNDPKTISIEAIFGLGSPVVSGEITPDQYLLDKDSLKIIKKQVVKQTWQLILAGKTKISKDFQSRQKLNDAKINQLGGLAKKIENHYSVPQDIEWAFQNHKLYIVQARPVTTLKVNDDGERPKALIIEQFQDKLLLQGIPASFGVGVGPVSKVSQPKDITKVKKGQVLVAKMTSPDFVPAMKRAAAIVTDEGGRTSHAAIVSRELLIPCVVGTQSATKMLKEGEIVTVDGGAGKVYEGLVELRIKNEELGDKKQNSPVKTATKVYLNLADPESALSLSRLPVDGVGLMRAEFIMAGIGDHPKAVIEKGQSQKYTDRLAQEIAKVAKAFAPRPVVYRASDFKSNEYRHLRGGEKYESFEENPMIGFRGALRYVTDPEVFGLELKAILKVRHKLNLRNLGLMIPFVRTVTEFREVKKIIAASGLKRGGSFKLWLMVEIPANVILLEEFASEGIDGISIGSNDLAMLVLGADRDNSRLSKIYTEENEAVRELIGQAIKTAKRLGIVSSLCGEAVSTYPNLLKMLVRLGITSVSVDPDAVLPVKEAIAKEEKNLIYGGD